MKYLFFFFTMLFLGDNFAQNRQTLWLSGIGPTSSPWDNAISSALGQGYKLTAVPTYNVYRPHLDKVVGSANKMNDEIEEMNDVLGIGHDGGGIVLRQMANDPNSNLSAIILDGVPNQGAKVLTKIIPTTGGKSVVETMIDEVLAFKSNAQNCNACQIVEYTKNWANEIKDLSAAYEEFFPNSSILQNLGSPPIPYAVIWGHESDKEEAHALARMLGARSQQFNQAADTRYLECYKDEINDRKSKVKGDEINSIVNSIFGAADGIIKTLKGDAVGGITSIIKSLFNRIKEARQKDKDLAELLECEMIFQGLNAYWNILVAGGPVITETITVEYDCCAYCYTEPDAQVQGWCFSDCMAMQWPCSYTKNISYIVFEPHDGLLTKNEQLLEGAAKTYEAKNTNHFQEQFWAQQPIKDAFVDLFNGGAGVAFRVPK